MIIYQNGNEYDTALVDTANAKAEGERTSHDVAHLESFKSFSKYNFNRVVDCVNEFGPKVSTVAEVNARLLDPDILTYTKVKTKLTGDQLTYILDFYGNHVS